jgi:hypothetical protein
MKTNGRPYKRIASYSLILAFSYRWSWSVAKLHYFSSLLNSLFRAVRRRPRQSDLPASGEMLLEHLLEARTHRVENTRLF